MSWGTDQQIPELPFALKNITPRGGPNLQGGKSWEITTLSLFAHDYTWKRGAERRIPSIESCLGGV
jgi:hypothetical protein